MADLPRSRPPEHHVELGKAKDERVVAIHQDHLDVLPELVREAGDKFESAESGTQHEHTHSGNVHWPPLPTQMWRAFRSHPPG
jgi:hypothetical protein